MIASASSSRRNATFTLLLLVISRGAAAAPWQPDPNRAVPDDGGGVAQKVELVDIDADGFVDLAFANSRGDALGGDADAQLNALVHNDGGLGFSLLPGVFEEPDNAYVIKAGDLNGDGLPDLVVGVAYSGASYVLLNLDGAFLRHDILGGAPFSVGDLELGDVDGDGSLDIVAADWGVSQPLGEPGDGGGPLRLWLGHGNGLFTDGAAFLPGSLLSWSFDLELLDFDNDFDLDVLAASRGPGPAVALRNDDGVFVVHPIPALANKEINSAFTVLDLDADADLDLVTLQDGFGGARNTVLVGDGAGGFVDNLGAYWALVDNPIRLDFDADSLDFDNDGTPDVVVLGPQQNPGEVHARLMRNDGSSLVPTAPDGAAFAPVPELLASFGVAIADFDLDRRADLAVAVRSDVAPDAVLFGGQDVPEDSTPPRLGIIESLPAVLFPGTQALVRARVDDGRVPARWHDFRHDPLLPTYHLHGGGSIAHLRRVPSLEFAFDLADPAELAALADDDPLKHIAPGEWYGEALWRVAFDVPQQWAREHAILVWRLCASDAAGNRSCSEPATSSIARERPNDCGNGTVEPWEDCDDAVDLLCQNCTFTCGDGACIAPEDGDNCPADCAGCDDDGACEPGEDETCCDCTRCGVCGDGVCHTDQESAIGCPEDCSACGDGICDLLESEQSCSFDCAVCGDGLCSGLETSVDCPWDCSICGDCVCEGNENPDNCWEDCGLGCDDPTHGSWCGDGVCAPEERGSCLEDCPACGDGTCTPGEQDCEQDCGVCGDCLCQIAENPENCPEDCGDGVCGEGEDSATTAPEPDAVDDGLGCSCRDASGGGGLVFGLGLLARRRRRGGRSGMS
ncbi:Repeat domain-containing protein [Nannocystis exedens]|uniref:Repeat domain-containing protein n=1 Tax=Nannocystis exedens TaxID=54 RepID=A0A1I1SQ50_9BACT|nr:VCBS repeat-containing protein [Nannocystis exedens]PCC75649.1 FG-GAP repeat protein [Nannocystis exedens]SFD48452.1 Repeat domain-containing protein [Nannocystis exedens]